jgi:hypothetical protein
MSQSISVSLYVAVRDLYDLIYLCDFVCGGEGPVCVNLFCVFVCARP